MFFKLTALIAALLLFYSYASAENIPEKQQITFEASVGFFNKYIFRGYELSKNSMVIQPSVSASFKGFEASVWGNIDTNQHKTQSFDPGNSEGKGRYNETEYSLSYTFKTDKLSLTGGFMHYDFKYWDNTDELFISATYNILTKPTLAVYHDINAYPGAYINLSFAHSLDVGKGTTLDLGASVGYYSGNGSCWNTYEYATGGYTGSKYNALHDGMVKAGLTIPLLKGLTVQPIVEYWFPLSGKAGKTMGYNAAAEKISYNPDGYVGYNFVTGINVSYRF